MRGRWHTLASVGKRFCAWSDRVWPPLFVPWCGPDFLAQSHKATKKQDDFPAMALRCPLPLREREERRRRGGRGVGGEAAASRRGAPPPPPPPHQPAGSPAA